MNKNTISLPSIEIEIQKLTPLQFQLLQLVDKSIREMNSEECSINLNEFGSLKPIDIFNSARENIEIVVINKKIIPHDMKSFKIIGDIHLVETQLKFRPSKFFLDLIKEFPKSAKNRYIKNILFHGVRNKQSLLLIEYLTKRNPTQKEQHINVTVLDLRKILDFDNETYTPDSLKRLVLDRCVKEISANTNLIVTISKKMEPMSKNAKKMKISSFDILFRLKT
jgi:hypothetical protein